MSYGDMSFCCDDMDENSGAAAFRTLELPTDDGALGTSSLTSHSTFSDWYSPRISVAGVESLANSYALRFGLCGIAGAARVARASRGEARGEEKGDAVEDLVLPNVDGMKPGGASGLTASLGDAESGVEDPRHEAGDGRRKMDARMGGGDAEEPPPSRNLHMASRIALSRVVPRRFVSFLSRCSSLSVLSSSSKLVFCRIGRHKS